LEIAFAETHAAETGATPIAPELSNVDSQVGAPETTGVPLEVIHLIGDAHANRPEGFTVHPKLQQQLDKRVEMSRNGGIDWGSCDLLAFGSPLLEGMQVRLAGHDSSRSTFVQGLAVLHLPSDGQEWLPLAKPSANQRRLFMYASLLSEYAAMACVYGYSV